MTTQPEVEEEQAPVDASTPPSPLPETEPTPEQPTRPAAAPAAKQAPPGIPAGPAALIAAEATTMAGVGIWHATGPAGLAVAAVTAAGGVGWLVYRRVRRRGGRDRVTARWAGSRMARLGMPSGAGRRSSARSAGSPGRSGRGSAGRPRLPGARGGGRSGRSAGGAGRKAAGPPKSFGGPANRARVPGVRGRTASAPGIHRPAASRAVGKLKPAARGTSSAARKAARRMSGLAERTGRGMRAAHQAARAGHSPRETGRAARAAAAAPARGRAFRRLAGRAAVTMLGWGWGVAWRTGSHLVAKVRNRFRPEPDGETAEPTIGATVNRPKHAPHSSPTWKAGPTVSTAKPSFVEAAEEFAEAIEKYEPPEGAGGMMQMLYDLAQFPDALKEISKGFRAFAAMCSNDLPLHEHIADLIESMATVQDQIAETAEDIPHAIVRLHPEDVERNENPRPREQDWNVA